MGIGTKVIDTSRSDLSEEELSEVLSRLTILYSNSDFKIENQSILVTPSEAEIWPEIKLATHDQLLRTKYERHSHKLREHLYNRLLG